MLVPKHPILICNICACLFGNKFIKHLGLKKNPGLSIYYSSSSTGGKSTALIKCCIFQMNKNHFRTPGGQHKSLSTSPYSQHQPHHLQGSQFFFYLGGSLHRNTLMCSLVLAVPHPTYLLPVSSSITDPGASPLPPSSFLSLPQEMLSGLSPRDGSSCTPAQPPPRSPCVAAAAHPAYKGRGANFLWHMLLESALLHLLSGFVVFKIAEAPLLSQHSLSLSIQPANTLVFCPCKHSWLL